VNRNLYISLANSSLNEYHKDGESFHICEKLFT